MHVSSVEAAIYNVAYTHLLRNTFLDEMDSTLFRSYVFLSNIPTRVLPRLLGDTSTTIFDDVLTPRKETKQHILIRSITDAVAELRGRFGPDMNSWMWGAMHTVEFKHPLGGIGPLDRLFNVGPIAVGGNNTTVNNGEFSFTDPYRASVGPSMRFIVDLSSPDSSYIILPTGQSGQPFSDHYADQTALWQSGAMHRLTINKTAIRQSGWPRLLLQPAH
jgi:penicillin amidase